MSRVLSDELEKALKKFDETTKQRLASKIISLAEKETVTSSQRGWIQGLKVLCPIALFFSTPIVAFFYGKLDQGLDQMIFMLSLVPLGFLALITAIVNFVLKTPD